MIHLIHHTASLIHVDQATPSNYIFYECPSLFQVDLVDMVDQMDQRERKEEQR